MSNTFGRLFRLTTFGESHGPALGGVIDGCPPGLEIDLEFVRRALEQRAARPGNPAATARREPDEVHFLSGILDGRSTGAPIGFVIENRAQDSSDYEELREIFRPGHGDYAWQARYGLRDWRGGGRASARETVSRVVGGALAQLLLARRGISVRGCTLALGGIAAESEASGREIRLACGEALGLAAMDAAEGRKYFSPLEEVIPRWEEAIQKARAAGDSLGGLVRLEALGLPPPPRPGRARLRQARGPRGRRPL